MRQFSGRFRRWPCRLAQICRFWGERQTAHKKMAAAEDLSLLSQHTPSGSTRAPSPPPHYCMPNLATSDEASAVRRRMIEEYTSGLVREDVAPEHNRPTDVRAEAHRRRNNFNVAAEDKTAPLPECRSVRKIGIMHETSPNHCFAGFSPPTSPPGPPVLARPLTRRAVVWLRTSMQLSATLCCLARYCMSIWRKQSRSVG